MPARIDAATRVRIAVLEGMRDHFEERGAEQGADGVGHQRLDPGGAQEQRERRRARGKHAAGEARQPRSTRALTWGPGFVTSRPRLYAEPDDRRHALARLVPPVGKEARAIRGRAKAAAGYPRDAAARRGAGARPRTGPAASCPGASPRMRQPARRVAPQERRAHLGADLVGLRADGGPEPREHAAPRARPSRSTVASITPAPGRASPRARRRPLRRARRANSTGRQSAASTAQTTSGRARERRRRLRGMPDAARRVHDADAVHLPQPDRLRRQQRAQAQPRPAALFMSPMRARRHQRAHAAPAPASRGAIASGIAACAAQLRQELLHVGGQRRAPAHALAAARMHELESAACSAWRAKRHARARDAAPVDRIADSGWPMCCRCTRIWCVRPVSRRHSSSAASPKRSSTR